MTKLLFIPLVAMGLAVGCVTSNAPDRPVSESTVLNAWFEALDRENFALHDELLKALFLSRNTGHEVFVRRLVLDEEAGGEADSVPRRYHVSLERGGADNVVGVNFATREFRLDHFTPADGPTLQQVRERLENKQAIRRLKRDLGIFGEE